MSRYPSTTSNSYKTLFNREAIHRLYGMDNVLKMINCIGVIKRNDTNDYKDTEQEFTLVKAKKT